MSSRGLRVDTSGIRKRIRNMPDSAYRGDGDDNKEYLYLQMKDDHSLSSYCSIGCAVALAVWVVSLVTGILVSVRYACDLTKGLIQPAQDCPGPEFIYQPVRMDHADLVMTSMKSNRRVRFDTLTAASNAKFSVTANSKRNLHEFSNAHICSVVYSNRYSSRIGEVAIPLTALLYEDSIDQMVVVDDLCHAQTTQLWEKEILFGAGAPSAKWQLSPDTFASALSWDAQESVKQAQKQFVRTNQIGLWKAYEMASRLAYVPPSVEDADKQEGAVELLLLLDTDHQLPMHDAWVRDAVALFAQYPKLKVLGGFSGVLRNGITYGDVNIVDDVRTAAMDKEQQAFVMSSRTAYYRQQQNTRRFDESRARVVQVLDGLKEQYYDAYVRNFWQKAKQMYQHGVSFEDDESTVNTPQQQDNDHTDTSKAGLFSMHFLDDYDAAVMFDDSDPHRVQTGFEGIEHVLKKRFLQYYEHELEKRLPISAHTLKKLAQKRIECKKIMKDAHSATAEERADCEEPTAAEDAHDTLNYHFIPYEQRIPVWDDQLQARQYTYVPFMFVTAVRLGPIFVRRDWWFDELLPHLTTLDRSMGSLRQDWLDIEMSLYTWALGGHVGLYDADGFKFDRKQFDQGLKRNRGADAEWETFQKTHHLTQYAAGWNVWNVTHLIRHNEETESAEMLRVRTPDGASSVNHLHPTAVENSRQIMLIERSFEETFDVMHDSQELKHENENEGTHDAHPFLRLKEQDTTDNKLNRL